MRAAWAPLAALACALSAHAQAPTPAGLWRTYSDRTGRPDGMVRVVERDGVFEGTVTAVFSPPAASRDPRCEGCQGELKNQPVVGMTILRGLRWDGKQYAGGEILDPDDGKRYRCRMRLLDYGRLLEVRGYLGVPLLGRTQVWRRYD